MKPLILFRKFKQNTPLIKIKQKIIASVIFIVCLLSLFAFNLPKNIYNLLSK